MYISIYYCYYFYYSYRRGRNDCPPGKFTMIIVYCVSNFRQFSSTLYTIRYLYNIWSITQLTSTRQTFINYYYYYHTHWYGILSMRPSRRRPIVVVVLYFIIIRRCCCCYYYYYIYTQSEADLNS